LQNLIFGTHRRANADRSIKNPADAGARSARQFRLTLRLLAALTGLVALALARLVALLAALTGPRLILLPGLLATALLLAGLVPVAALVLLARILILVRIIH
jgi:hypothetical protein